MMKEIKAALSAESRRLYMEANPDVPVLWPTARAELEGAGLTVFTQPEWLSRQWRAYREAAGIPILSRDEATTQVELMLANDAGLYTEGQPDWLVTEASIRRRCT